MAVTQSVPRRAGQATDNFLRWAWALVCFALPFLLIVVPILAFLVQSFFYVEDGEIVRSLTLDVNRHPILTRDRRPKLTPGFGQTVSARRAELVGVAKPGERGLEGTRF